MVFVDSNVVMYLVGGDNEWRVDAQRALERQVAERTRLITSAEVLQEILHRYVAIDRRDAIQPALNALLTVVDEVLSVERQDVLDAKQLLDRHRLSARDALHIAVMKRAGGARMLSFDAGFDRVPGIERLS
jgi:predicted nucleic acid-binding protein